MLLEVHNVSKEYVRGERKFLAVNDVSLSVDKNDFISLIGHSGSGKSTLLSIIAGLLKPSSGNVLINDTDINSLTDKEISLFRNRAIGYVPQGDSLLSNLTVFDNVRLPYCLYHNDNSIDTIVEELLEKLGIAALKNSYPSSLSGGERKRVAVARALINKPEFLLADEPTSDLDAKNTSDILDLFKTLASQGTAVIVATHELETLNYGNKIFEMSEGVLQTREEISVIN